MSKKLFAIAAALLMTFTAAQAQALSFDEEEKKHEISVTYGVEPLAYTVKEFTDVFAHALGSAFSRALFGTDVHFDNKECFGAINVDYNYRIDKWCALGANLSYSQATGDITGKSEEGSGRVVTGKATDSYYTIMPNMKLQWFNKKYCSMYSRLSIGLCILNSTMESSKEPSKNQSETDTFCMFQVSLYGIEVGPKNCRAFLEAGVGQCGVAQFGVRARF